MVTAWTATPKKRSRDDEPSDFSTAKSRRRSSDETYMSAATMIAATTHISARELSIEATASFMAWTVSSFTCSEREDGQVAGRVGGGAGGDHGGDERGALEGDLLHVVDRGVDVRDAAEQREPVGDADDRELGAGQVDALAHVDPEPIVDHDLAGARRPSARRRPRACPGRRAGDRSGAAGGPRRRRSVVVGTMASGSACSTPAMPATSSTVSSGSAPNEVNGPGRPVGQHPGVRADAVDGVRPPRRGSCSPAR